MTVMEAFSSLVVIKSFTDDRRGFFNYRYLQQDPPLLFHLGDLCCQGHPEEEEEEEEEGDLSC